MTPTTRLGFNAILAELATETAKMLDAVEGMTDDERKTFFAIIRQQIVDANESQAHDH